MPKIPKEAETRVSAKFQARLKEFMSDAESNNAGYAKAVGVSRDVITRATIYGIVPALRSLIKIADHENVSLAYLLAESDEHSFYKSETPKTFEQRVIELKDKANKTLPEIAAVMPFANNSFSELFAKGTLPSLDYLKALAEYFKVSADYLLGRTDDKN